MANLSLIITYRVLEIPNLARCPDVSKAIFRRAVPNAWTFVQTFRNLPNPTV